MSADDVIDLTITTTEADTEDDRRAILKRIFERCEVQEKCAPGMDEPCWIWQGSTSGTTGRGCNYPRMKLNSQTVAVHRVVATHFHGYLHSNRQVDHKCKNRLCLNPKHLEPVTQKENCRRRDKANKAD